ncbi:MAG: hypothetical protein ACHQK9_12305, partial [Reyranellales bacterium]
MPQTAAPGVLVCLPVRTGRQMVRGIGRRHIISTLAGAAVAGPLAAQAQPAGKVARIGFLYPGLATVTASRIAAVREGMRAVGYKDADRVEFLARSSDGDPKKLDSLAADLVERKVDLIVSVSFAGLRA